MKFWKRKVVYRPTDEEVLEAFERDNKEYLDGLNSMDDYNGILVSIDTEIGTNNNYSRATRRFSFTNKSELFEKVYTIYIYLWYSVKEDDCKLQFRNKLEYMRWVIISDVNRKKRKEIENIYNEIINKK